MKGFAIHNAPTDHGGTIPSTLLSISQKDNAFVRAGDGHYCPQCKCWSTVQPSHNHVIFDGKPVAYTGDKLSCGARISEQQFHVVGDSHSSNSATNANSSNSLQNTTNTPADQKSSNSNKDLEKKIIEIYWSYGADQIKLSEKSRFYTDLNLHIKTINYQPGEMIEAILHYDDTEPLTESLDNLKVQGVVGKDGEVVIKDILKNQTLNLR